MSTDDEHLYSAYGERHGRGARIDRAKLHPHPHGVEQARDADARNAERRSMQQAIRDKIAAAKNPPPAPPPVAQPKHDGNQRKAEARHAFVTMQVWVNGMVEYVDVKTT